MSYSAALLATVCAETLVLFVLLRFSSVQRTSLAVALLCMLAINLISHPLGWFAVSSCGANWLLIETAVVLTEFALIRAIITPKLSLAGFLAVTANGVTMLLGAIPLLGNVT